MRPLKDLLQTDDVTRRHIGPTEAEQAEMLAELGVSSLDELTETTLPEAIRFTGELNVGGPVTEAQALADLKAVAAKNKVFRSYIGMGYHGTHVPPVILRNMMENPGWYTAYTPYQAEISQGRLELLFHFQTLVTELTGLPVASARITIGACRPFEPCTVITRTRFSPAPASRLSSPSPASNH